MAWPPRFCESCGARVSGTRVAESRVRDRHSGEVDEPLPLYTTCPGCGALRWRNAKPCAGVLIERDGAVLLARRGVPPRRDHWDVVGGFLRPDEHPEDGARREALEETGLHVQLNGLLGIWIDRYDDGTHPAAGDPAGPSYDGLFTLNIYYRARIAPGTVPRAADDVSELRFFRPDQWPTDLAFKHEHALLEAWTRHVGD